MPFPSWTKQRDLRNTFQLQPGSLLNRSVTYTCNNPDLFIEKLKICGYTDDSFLITLEYSDEKKSARINQLAIHAGLPAASYKWQGLNCYNLDTDNLNKIAELLKFAKTIQENFAEIHDDMCDALGIDTASITPAVFALPLPLAAAEDKKNYEDEPLLPFTYSPNTTYAMPVPLTALSDDNAIDHLLRCTLKTYASCLLLFLAAQQKIPLNGLIQFCNVTINGKTGSDVIERLFYTSKANFFIENRHRSPELQKAYDDTFGVVLWKKPQEQAEQQAAYFAPAP